MTLVDTSAWVAFLQADGSATDRALTRLLEEGAPLWTTATVVAEILAGAADEDTARRASFAQHGPATPAKRRSPRAWSRPWPFATGSPC